MDEINLSPYGSASTTPSPVNRMMAAFADDFREGVDINLGMGYVSEQAIPHHWIRDALGEVIDRSDRHKAPFNYGGPAGSPNLVAAIRRFYVKRRIGGFTSQFLDTKRIVVGVSGATSLMQAVAQVIRPGLVVTSDPLYYIYGDVLQRAGFSLLTVPEDAEGIDTARLEKKLADLGRAAQQISFVYVVTVSNPTCTITSTARRRELVRIVSDLSRRLGRKIPLLLDAAYELLIHDPAVAKPESALLTDRDGIAYELGTLSKILAPALRAGYVIGPDGPFMDALVQNVSDTGFSAPLANQEIASCLLNDHVDEQLERVNAGYRRKAIAMRVWIDKYLGRYLRDVCGGQAGFYFYLTFDGVDTREESAFFKVLTRTTGDPALDSADGSPRPRVLYLPGEYCVHRDGELVDAGGRQLRLSYGFESLERIEYALRLMGEAAAHVMSVDPCPRRV